MSFGIISTRDASQLHPADQYYQLNLYLPIPILRIISGFARGRKLIAPPGRTQNIRPTSDRAREALFSILGNHTQGSRVIDLYAGTGALGLEALSRGAKELIFVDFHRQSLELIQRNVQICQPGNEHGRTSIIRYDLRKGLPPHLIVQAEKQKFDLIFLDPPYSLGLCLKTLECLANSKILTTNAIVVAEERSCETLPNRCGVLTLTDQRNYGDTGFWIYSPYHSTNNTFEERE